MPACACGPWHILCRFYSQHGVTDCAWSESNEFHLLSACADGTIKLWDLVASGKDGFPLQNYAEHAQDCGSVAWNPVAKDCFATGSWDTTVKLWRPEVPHSVATFGGHAHSVFGVAWNVYQPTVLASCSGRCALGRSCRVAGCACERACACV